MKNFTRFILVVLYGAAAALAGCATVDLGPDTGAPRVRMPDEASIGPPPVAPASRYEPAQTMPVAPGWPVAQPLPPAGRAVGDANAPAADAHLVTLSGRLDGASVVPSTASGATAQIDLLYDDQTRLLRWKARWTNLSSPIAAISFFGPAAPDQAGPPALIWPAPFGTRYEGRATLTPQQATNLIGGLWYVNISTMNYPGGEIRGQLQVVY